MQNNTPSWAQDPDSACHNDSPLKRMIDTVKVSIWQEDASALLHELNQLRATGLTDIQQHLDTNPHYLGHLISLVQIEDVNQATLVLFGARDLKHLRDNFQQILDNEHAHRAFRELVIAMWQGEESFSAEVYYKTLDGGDLHAIISSPLWPCEEKMRCVPVSLQDITALKKAEQSLAASENRYRVLFEKSRDAILIIEDGVFVECNDATRKMLGYANRAELLQTHPSQLSPPFQPDGSRSDEKAERMMAIALEHGSHRFEWDHQRANGEVFPVDVLLTTFEQDNGKRIIHTVWRDITLQKQQRERIQYQAHYDSLTGLPNRFLALDRLNALLQRSDRQPGFIAVIFLDLDDFKKVNDSLGHDAGDQLLKETAQRLTAVMRKGDTIARLGGDEFLILLDGIRHTDAICQVSEHVLAVFQHSIPIQGRQLTLTASLGIALCPQDGAKADELLRKADIAMYHSKRRGRNCYHFFSAEMNRQVVRRLELEEHLLTALERNEFELYFQPLIGVRSGQLIGAEALLRWHNPTLGSVSPEEFIPVAEQTGQIMALGHYVLEQAISMAARCQPLAPPGFRIAINLSPCQFRDNRLLAMIENLLTRARLGGQAIELEITEGVLINSHGPVQHLLRALSGLGIRLAMDDFGTGYSSLSYLRDYPFDSLKIDRSFINDITGDANNHELINATIAMAHGLGLHVVAEGVETREQLNYLSLRACDAAQGYYFSKPLSVEAFMYQWLQPGDTAQSAQQACKLAAVKGRRED